MTKRVPLTLEQANALKPGDRFRDLGNGSVHVVVAKENGTFSCFMDEQWVWSVPEAKYEGPTQESDGIYKFDEMAAYDGVFLATLAQPAFDVAFSVSAGDRCLLKLKADGTVEANLDDVDEAARIFVESLSKYWLQTTGKSVVNVNA